MVANLTVRSLEYTSDLQSHIEIVCHLLLEKKPKPPATVCGKPSRWCGQSVQILLNYVGCEARKLPAGGEVFFLDFSFYRAYRVRREKAVVHSGGKPARELVRSTR